MKDSRVSIQIGTKQAANQPKSNISSLKAIISTPRLTRPRQGASCTIYQPSSQNSSISPASLIFRVKSIRCSKLKAMFHHEDGQLEIH